MESVIESFSKFINSFYSAPGYVLVAATCIIFGYALRLVKKFPNEGIPFACVLIGMILTPLVDEAEGVTKATFRIWLLRNIMIGGIVGAIAWGAHKLIISRFEDKLPLLGGMLQKVDDPKGPGQ